MSRCALAGAVIAFAIAAPSALGDLYPGAPDPGGDPSQAVPAPPSGGKVFGYHDERIVHFGQSAPALANAAARAGANAFRFSINWHNVEPSRDSWDGRWWDRYTRIHNALVTRGVRPVLTLGGVPPWARTAAGRYCGVRRGCEYPPAHWADGEWTEFVRAVVRRLPYTTAVEPWNEPNLRAFYKPAPNPERWAQIVRATHAGVQEANPGVTVLAGGLAPAVTRKYDLFGHLDIMPLREFLERAYAAAPSIAGRMDGISFHLSPQSLDAGAGSLVAKAFEDARSVRDRFGDFTLPLWLTESGFSTTGPSALSPDHQAEGLLSLYRRVMTMDDTRGLIVHTLVEDTSVPATDLRRGWGVTSSLDPLIPKPAYCAFAVLAAPEPPAGC